jgi:putative CocE/NonD family hydrolase
VRIVHGLRVLMRDGVELALDLIRPDLPAPLPVVLMRTPYDKVSTREFMSGLPQRLAERGYVVALNDCRGRFNSDGSFQPNFDEADDGFDTIEWIAAQGWCDGNVGMLGASYVADTQWYAASRRPPHLRAIVPICAQPGSLWRNEPIFNGCFMLPQAEWMVGMGRRSWQLLDRQSLWTREQDYFETLPISAIPGRAGVDSVWWDEWMEHPTFDSFWQQGSKTNHAEMDVAALNITGWWDSNSPGGPMNFEDMRLSAAAGRRKLVIGPWPHWVNRSQQLSGVDFGEGAIVALDDYIIRFYDRWLKNTQNGIDDEKPVHVFVVGANEWWAEDDWPLPDTDEVAYFLHSRGRANTLRGDGHLSLEPPRAEPSDAFRYDPLDPVRVLWTLHQGPVDDRLQSTRNDCLCYTSEPLSEPLDVVGWVTCRLYASSSALDTDWHVRLVDVHPDGAARFLCKGALRARFRDSLEEPTPLKRNTPTLFELRMDACGVRFLPGHRIRVEVTSSWFTLWDRNTNSGAANFFKDETIVVADQRIYHQQGLASCVLLPVVRR